MVIQGKFSTHVCQHALPKWIWSNFVFGVNCEWKDLLWKFEYRNELRNLHKCALHAGYLTPFNGHSEPLRLSKQFWVHLHKTQATRSREKVSIVRNHVFFLSKRNHFSRKGKPNGLNEGLNGHSAMGKVLHNFHSKLSDANDLRRKTYIGP